MISTDFITIALAVVGLLGTAMHVYTKLMLRIGALEQKVETMWAFQMRRAVSEAVNTKIGNMNSPLKVSEKAKEFLEPIKVELQNCWKYKWAKMASQDCLLDIELMFGQRLLTMICVPCGLSHGACLIVAFSVASGQDVSTDFDQKMKDVK